MHPTRNGHASPWRGRLWLTAGAVGLPIAWAGLNYRYPQIHLRGMDWRSVAWFVVAASLATVACAALFRMVQPRLLAYARPQQALWLLGALLAGAFLVVVIPLPAPLALVCHTLAITATGQKDPAAFGSEVWLQGLDLPDGTQVPLPQFVLDGGWEIKNNVPVSYRHQPATLRWAGCLRGTAQLRLSIHPWSGVAQITRGWPGADRQSVRGCAGRETFPTHVAGAGWRLGLGADSRHLPGG